MTENENDPSVLVLDVDSTNAAEYGPAIARLETAAAWARADRVIDRHGRVLKAPGGPQNVKTIYNPSEAESLIVAALTVAASEWGPETTLSRGQAVRLGAYHVIRTLRRHGYLRKEFESDPDSWEGDTAVWSIADARTTVLLHGASTVGREIELAVESYDGSVRLTDDQASRVADALRAAATWRQK